MFHVGQKVVCVDDSPGAFSKCRLLALKQIYTVTAYIPRGIGAVSPTEIGIVDGVKLAEVDTGPDFQWFLASRFRPVKETDISIFTAMLAPKPLTLDQECERDTQRAIALGRALNDLFKGAA